MLKYFVSKFYLPTRHVPPDFCKNKPKKMIIQTDFVIKCKQASRVLLSSGKEIVENIHLYHFGFSTVGQFFPQKSQQVFFGKLFKCNSITLIIILIVGSTRKKCTTFAVQSFRLHIPSTETSVVKNQSHEILVTIFI